MKKLKIYLDNCCYNRPYDDTSQLKIKMEIDAKMFIQELSKKNNVILVWSFMLDYENEKNPFDDKRNAIGLWRSIAHEYCSANETIRNRAADLQTLGLHAEDSLHISCAIQSECDYFISTDRKLISKKVEGITLINPIDFIYLLEE